MALVGKLSMARFTFLLTANYSPIKPQHSSPSAQLQDPIPSLLGLRVCSASNGCTEFDTCTIGFFSSFSIEPYARCRYLRLTARVPPVCSMKMISTISYVVAVE